MLYINSGCQTDSTSNRSGIKISRVRHVVTSDLRGRNKNDVCCYLQWHNVHIKLRVNRLVGLRIEIRNITHADIKIDDMALRDKIK